MSKSANIHLNVCVQDDILLAVNIYLERCHGDAILKTLVSLKLRHRMQKYLKQQSFGYWKMIPPKKLAMLKAFTSILGWLIQFLRALCFVFHRAIVYLQLYHVNMMNEPSFCDVKDGTSMPPTADEARFWLVNYSAAPAFLLRSCRRKIVASCWRKAFELVPGSFWYMIHIYI